MTSKDRILAFLKEKAITKERFYEISGFSASNFKGVARNSELSGDKLAKILTIFPEINADWLVTGRGEMFKNKSYFPQTLKECQSTNANQHPGINQGTDTNQRDDINQGANANQGINGSNNQCPDIDSRIKPIPLVREVAVGGFGNSDFTISKDDIIEYYVIPKFKYCNIDFMIEVAGNSMCPSFNPGSIIACTILHESKFIQWNKCHVIATREQGILVKRLLPGTDEQHLKAVSENQEYPPFEIPVNEVTGIALVKGSISLE
jgi:phage repressor protein C with HTH and peptisase S24 domain